MKSRKWYETQSMATRRPNEALNVSAAPATPIGTAQKSEPRMNAIVALEVASDASMPTGMSAAPASQKPRYVAAIRPMSGLPSHMSTSTWLRESSSEAVNTPSTATYFPSTRSTSRAGSVRSSSSVPCLRSSAHTPMVRAGTKKASTYGKTSLS